MDGRRSVTQNGSPGLSSWESRKVGRISDSQTNRNELLLLFETDTLAKFDSRKKTKLKVYRFPLLLLQRSSFSLSLIIFKQFKKVFLHLRISNVQIRFEIIPLHAAT